MSFLPGSDEEETTSKDVKPGLDKVGGRVRLKSIALESLKMTHRVLLIHLEE